MEQQSQQDANDEANQAQEPIDKEKRMGKRNQHQCNPACDIPGPGLAKHNREVLASLNEDVDVQEFAPEFREAVNVRKPWPALVKQWADRGVAVDVDEYGLYSHRDEKTGVTLYSCSLGAPPKPTISAHLPALTSTGEPSILPGFARTRMRDLRADELDKLHEELSKVDLEDDQQGIPQPMPGPRRAVRIGSRIYVLHVLACRTWRPEELAEREEKYRREVERIEKQTGPDYAAIPMYEPAHKRTLPIANASVIVTDLTVRAGTLYIETELEKDALDVFS